MNRAESYLKCMQKLEKNQISLKTEIQHKQKSITETFKEVDKENERLESVILNHNDYLDKVK